MIPWMVKHHPQEGNPLSKGLSPTNPREATHHNKDGHPLSNDTVAHHPQGGHPTTVEWSAIISTNGHLDLDFDSNAAQLVRWGFLLLLFLLLRKVMPTTVENWY